MAHRATVWMLSLSLTGSTQTVLVQLCDIIYMVAVQRVKNTLYIVMLRLDKFTHECKFWTRSVYTVEYTLY